MCVLILIYCFFFLLIRRPPRSTHTDTLFPDTTLFRACVEEVLLQGVHEAGVSVLILIDQQNWIARGHHGPKLGPCEERGHEREHVLVPQDRKSTRLNSSH